MRMAILGLETAKGALIAEAANSVVGLIAKARVIRDSGKLDKTAIRCGMVMSSDKGVVMQFRCTGSTPDVSGKTTGK